jgi:hypothetical protein
VHEARAICWAIACAISQPGHARAILFNDSHGRDIYMTDDHVSAGFAETFDPDKVTFVERPAVVLCADDATAAAILAPDLKDARVNGSNDPDLEGATLWNGTSMVDAYSTVLTTMPRADVEKLADVDDSSLDVRMPLFELPPVFFDGAKVLQALQQEAAAILAWEAQQEAEREREYQEGQAADLRREEQRLDPTTDNHEDDAEPDPR